MTKRQFTTLIKAGRLVMDKHGPHPMARSCAIDVLSKMADAFCDDKQFSKKFFLSCIGVNSWELP